MLPPLSTRFTLGPQITDEQQAFLDAYGFLVFSKVALDSEVRMILNELEAIQAQWLEEKRSYINGIPIFYGRDHENKPFVQRFTFTSMFSQKLKNFVLDNRFEPVRRLVGENARIGHDEKDGVVVNRYINVPGSAYPKLGWHTDGLRDLFYLRMPKQMLNVGLHFDRIRAEDGGLRLLPGSHTQGFWSMCFKKPYFIYHRPDPKELVVETEPGDLTVHDGRLWHRVAPSPYTGLPSLRRSMYVPYLTGPYEPKKDTSATPAYHHLGRFLRYLRQSLELAGKK
jgi:ectoine hydroxylase-related dioxygenase (phytanoyl-CoA dioxygenase family)